jgi:Cu-processing system permease protein
MHPKMFTFLASTLRAGIRGNGLLAIFFLGLSMVGIAYLSALFSPRQPETVALDVGLSGLRLALILLAIIGVQDLIGKEIEQKKIVHYLAFPIPRSQYLIGRFTGICLLLLISASILGGLLWVAVFSAKQLYTQAHACNLGLPYLFSIIGIWLDALVVMAFAICIASISRTTAFPLVIGIAFALAGHSMGAIVDYLHLGAYGRTDLVAHFGPIIDIAKWLIPDLSRLDWRVWPMYDFPLQAGLIPLSLLMSGCYIVLMLTIAVHTFNKREFD